MKSKFRKRSIHCAISYANSLYKDFTTHPEYLGIKFTWDKFPDMVATLAKVGLYMSFSDKEWKSLMRNGQIEILERLCYHVAFKTSKDLLKLGENNGY